MSFTEAYHLGDRVIVYEEGRVSQAAPRSELLWQPASESVARILGLRNILRGSVQEATPSIVRFQWRGQTPDLRTWSPVIPANRTGVRLPSE